MEKSIKLPSIPDLGLLFGPHDENIKLIEQEFQVKIIPRQQHLRIIGKRKNIEGASEFLEYLLNTISAKKELNWQDLNLYLSDFKKGSWKKTISSTTLDTSVISYKERKPVIPKTEGQLRYIEAIRTYDIVFAIGPAGTGKTYLAMASAVESLNNKRVRRIILTRPAIEAGESLGFLPGDMYEKILPYLRPLYDALYDMMEPERIEKYLETGIIEVAPLAYMRGRTLNDAFIILDEAQNATREQMKMFLTRLGFDSKAVITGDITQSDLPGGKPLGLLQAQELLKDIEGIKFIYLSDSDVVRHPLIQKIIKAYENTKNT
ncbi:MAG: PhoH family protein [Candidatus Omnitrophica bacterium]|nr:PhoH family protein [Candidatus Omnitrophota bacterium]